MTAIQLRGHHVLCLLGYRGKGYSEDFCTNMTAIYETLRTEPDTVVELIEGPDHICRAFPPDQPQHCLNASVDRKDRDILHALGTAPGLRVRWRALTLAASARLQPEDVGRLCADCQWEPLGLCSDGVRHIRSAGQLRELPEAE
ncbi:DUF1284 domain-containing protein [Paenibacillus sp. SYP-B4298]|uniref:DUF1284 domain-containing protein n=1 Tax=Paenibacillus sp. SYP-B4298 TaxID=2996034 RepID=UPI0022DD4E27|nr:DUF1284 domain-containing protein [Paenibacillus sp. SYP-B4298]